jgi:hypothetical protein
MSQNLDTKLRGIIIPSGSSAEEDIERAERAMKYNEETGSNAPYIVSGIGPDINSALKGREGNHDFHPELWNYLDKNVHGFFGVDMNSLDSIGNILNSLEGLNSGPYAIVSYPEHLKRLRRIADSLKRKGKISKNIKIVYVETIPEENQTFRQKVYETFANTKTHFKLRKL